MATFNNLVSHSPSISFFLYCLYDPNTCPPTLTTRVSADDTAIQTRAWDMRVATSGPPCLTRDKAVGHDCWMPAGSDAFVLELLARVHAEITVGFSPLRHLYLTSEQQCSPGFQFPVLYRRITNILRKPVYQYSSYFRPFFFLMFYL